MNKKANFNFRLVSEKEDLDFKLSRVNSEYDALSEIAIRRQDEIDATRREKRILEDDLLEARLVFTSFRLFVINVDIAHVVVVLIVINNIIVLALNYLLLLLVPLFLLLLIVINIIIITLLDYSLLLLVLLMF